MEIALFILGVAVVAAIFIVVGRVMYRPDAAGLTGISRAWGSRADFGDGDEDGGDRLRR